MDYVYELVGTLSWRMLIGEKLDDEVHRWVTTRCSSFFLPVGCLAVQYARSFLPVTLGDLLDLDPAQSLRLVLDRSTDLFHCHRSNMVRKREEHLYLQYRGEFCLEPPTGVRETLVFDPLLPLDFFVTRRRRHVFRCCSSAVQWNETNVIVQSNVIDSPASVIDSPSFFLSLI